MLNHKITQIYNTASTSSDKLKELQILSAKENNIKLINYDTIKRVFTFERDWEKMEQAFTYDGANEKTGFSHWYKNYNVKLHDIPTSFIPYIKFSLFFAYWDSNIVAEEYFSRNMFVFINKKKDGDENTRVENVDLYIPFEIRNRPGTTSAQQLHSKLILKIYNPHYYE